MLIPPKYSLTPKISQLLQSIESSKEVIESIFIPKEIEMNIRRKSTLKSALFSARIEGNSLTLSGLQNTSSKDQRKKEVFNILKALNFVYRQKVNKQILIKNILYLHTLTMEGLTSGEDLGSFRTQTSAIFNSFGIAIYLPPGPSKLKNLISKLLLYINSPKEPFVPIKACLAHLVFEKIHPFLDGNGRVGRQLLTLILANNGYGMKGLLSLEEYLDSHRSEYYESLEAPQNQTNSYLEFMLTAIAESSEEAKKEILTKKSLDSVDFLLPRRAELLNIIRDHKLVNFDFLKRRFMGVNERTLRFDLKKLADSGLVRKRGNTKGAYYEPIV